MKTMKNVFLILLAAVLMLSMAGAVAAEDKDAATDIKQDTTSSDAYVNLTTGTQTYDVLIPTKIVFNANGEDKTMYLNVSNVFIPQTHQLNVSVKSTNSWKMVNESKSLKYEMATGLLKNVAGTENAEVVGYTFKTDMENPPYKNAGEYYLICSISLGENEAKATTYFNTTLTFTLKDEIRFVGAYSDKLTFNFEVVEKPATT